MATIMNQAMEATGQGLELDLCDLLAGILEQFEAVCNLRAALDCALILREHALERHVLLGSDLLLELCQ